MTPKQNIERVEEFAPQHPRSMPQVVDRATMKNARRQWVVDNWVLAVMLLSIALFAGALAAYVFVPVARTLVGN